MNILITNHIPLHLLILSIFLRPIGGEYVTMKGSYSMERMTSVSNLQTTAGLLGHGSQATKSNWQHLDKDISMEYVYNNVENGTGTDNRVEHKECENVSEELTTMHSKDGNGNGRAYGGERLYSRTINSNNTTPALISNKSASKTSKLFIRVKTIILSTMALIGIVANIFFFHIVEEHGTKMG